MHWVNLLVDVISGSIAILLIYQVIVGIFALKKAEKVPAGDHFHRFALIIAARNEEAVIGNLIDSLMNQDYPREAFDVFVIADNCTDHTGEVAAAHGARVYCRQNRIEVGKGYALGWFFKQFLPEYERRYDAIGIFDADNLADKQFLSEMNAQLCAGQVAVMGYRDSKNPFDSWVTASTSISFWLVSRFYNQPRVRMGLSVLAGGTGYVFLTSLIAEGWRTKTISEDLEFSLQLITGGKRVGYTPYARFYDEQPTTMALSMRQRRRWAVGCYQNIRQGFPSLIAGLQTRAWPVVLDSLVFLMFMPLCAIQMVISTLQLLGIFVLNPASQWSGRLEPFIISGIVGLASMFGQAMLTLLIEKKFSYRILKGVLTFPLFLISNGLLYVLALVTPKISWHPIEHKRSVSLSQIDRG